MEWGAWARGSSAVERRGSHPAAQGQQPPSAGGQQPAVAPASDSYLRTLQYVKNCQDWSNSVGDGGAKPKRSPPHAAGAMPPPSSVPMPHAATNNGGIPSAMQNTMANNGSHMAAVAAAGMGIGGGGGMGHMPLKQDNMVLGDMNSSMSSLMEETRYLQMLQ